MNNLFLMGYRGSGKTTAAERVAAELGWNWCDADVVLEARAGRTIRQIFAEGGEAEFRDLESAVVADLAGGTNQIIALGGGAILREENRTAIRRGGLCCWLRAKPESLWARISADGSTAERRPNLTAAGGLEEVRRLLEARTPLYHAAADWIVDTDDKSPAAITAEIVSQWRARTASARQD